VEQEKIILILNELLNHEQSSLPLRLMESGTFVSNASVDTDSLVRRLARDAKRNAQTLSDVILRLGGTPAPRYPDFRLADIHFLELGHLLPQLIAERQSLRRKYESATLQLAAHPIAAASVHRILAAHRDELEALHRVQRVNPLAATA
jgi:hypothetical protein